MDYPLILNKDIIPENNAFINIMRVLTKVLKKLKGRLRRLWRGVATMKIRFLELENSEALVLVVLGRGSSYFTISSLQLDLRQRFLRDPEVMNSTGYLSLHPLHLELSKKAQKANNMWWRLSGLLGDQEPFVDVHSAASRFHSSNNGTHGANISVVGIAPRISIPQGVGN
ncbi:hypothetical protein Tco_0674280 [Tanacetum coccineum]